MKVLLLDNIRGIGQVGDIKEVSDGYARNFLLPRGLGKAASVGALKQVSTLKTKKLEAMALAHDAAVELTRTISGHTVTIHAKANEQGTLFSGVTAKEIAPLLSSVAGVHIPPEAISVGTHLKHVGVHHVTLELAEGVSADVTVDIQP